MTYLSPTDRDQVLLPSADDSIFLVTSDVTPGELLEGFTKTRVFDVLVYKEHSSDAGSGFMFGDADYTLVWVLNVVGVYKDDHKGKRIEVKIITTYTDDPERPRRKLTSNDANIQLRPNIKFRRRSKDKFRAITDLRDAIQAHLSEKYASEKYVSYA